jgi:hypothetical protein
VKSFLPRRAQDRAYEERKTGKNQQPERRMNRKNCRKQCIIEKEYGLSCRSQRIFQLQARPRGIRVRGKTERRYRAICNLNILI